MILDKYVFLKSFIMNLGIFFKVMGSIFNSFLKLFFPAVTLVNNMGITASIPLEK
jgi:hypothetical protein